MTVKSLLLLLCLCWLGLSLSVSEASDLESRNTDIRASPSETPVPRRLRQRRIQKRGRRNDKSSLLEFAASKSTVGKPHSTEGVVEWTSTRNNDDKVAMNFKAVQKKEQDTHTVSHALTQTDQQQQQLPADVQAAEDTPTCQPYSSEIGPHGVLRLSKRLIELPVKHECLWFIRPPNAKSVCLQLYIAPSVLTNTSPDYFKVYRADASEPLISVAHLPEDSGLTAENYEGTQVYTSNSTAMLVQFVAPTWPSSAATAAARYINFTAVYSSILDTAVQSCVPPNNPGPLRTEQNYRLSSAPMPVVTSNSSVSTPTPTAVKAESAMDTFNANDLSHGVASNVNTSKAK